MLGRWRPNGIKGTQHQLSKETKLKSSIAQMPTIFFVCTVFLKIARKVDLSILSTHLLLKLTYKFKE